MAVNIFDTRTMLPVVREIMPVRRFLVDTFFSNERVFDTEWVETDFVKSIRRLAPFINKHGGSKTVDRRGFENKVYTPAKVGPMMPTTAEDLMQRLPGENVYSTRTPQQRAVERLGTDLAELMEMIDRVEEWMAAQALFTGKLRCVNKDEGVDDEYDFGLTNFEDVKVKWDAAGSKPIDDIRRWRQKILQLTGQAPDVLLLDDATGAAFMANEQVREIVKAFRDYRIELNPTPSDNGTTRITRLPEFGIDVMTYSEWYVDPIDNKEKPMIPAGRSLLARRNSNFDLLYGACGANINGQLMVVPANRVPRSWTENNPPVRQVAVDSRPLPVINRINSLFVGQVMAAATK